MALEEGLADRSLAEMFESESNPRTISDERLGALKYALAKDPEMMRARPIIALPSGEVVAGNMRLRALKEMGAETAPVFVADLDEAKRREWMLRDNQEYGDWVPEDLAALIAAHQREQQDMGLLGFSESSIDKLLAQHAGDEAGDENGGGGEGALGEVWGVVVECESEDQQAELLDRLADEGFEVRALIP